MSSKNKVGVKRQAKSKVKTKGIPMTKATIKKEAEVVLTEAANSNGTPQASAPGHMDTPIPLEPSIGEPALPPISALGKDVVPVAEAIERVVQAPPALILSSLLAAMALAAQGQVNVKLFHGSVAPAVLFLLSLGESGSRKTTVCNNAMKGVNAAEDHMQQGASSKAERKQAQIQIRTGTLEGILKSLQNGRGSMGLFNDDAGSFLGGHAMSPENRMKSTAWLSQIWDGSSIHHTLANGDNEINMVGRRMSLFLSVQPKLFMPLLEDEIFFNEGILGRMLITAPKSNIGFRETAVAAEADLEIIRQFGDRLEKLLLVPLPYRAPESAEITPRTLALSQAATEVILRFAKAVEIAQRPGKPFARMTGPASKFAENATRIAAVLAYFEDQEAMEISGDQARRAVELMMYYGREMLRIFAVREQSAAIVDAQRILDWLQEKWVKPEIGFQDFYNYGPIRNADRCRPLVKILEEHHWLRRAAGTGYAGNGDKWTIVSAPKARDPFEDFDLVA